MKVESAYFLGLRAKAASGRVQVMAGSGRREDLTLGTTEATHGPRRGTWVFRTSTSLPSPERHGGPGEEAGKRLDPAAARANRKPEGFLKGEDVTWEWKKGKRKRIHGLERYRRRMDLTLEQQRLKGRLEPE